MEWMLQLNAAEQGNLKSS